MKRKYYLIILGILIFSFFVTFENKRVYTKDIEWVEGNQLEKITPWYGFDKPQLYIGEKIKIGIVDGPVSTTHNQTKSMNINTLMLNSDSTIADIEHGTSILGVITSDDNYGPFKSMLPNDNVEIYNAVVLSNGYASQSDIIKALIWLKEQDIDIINISIDLKEYNPDLERVIKEITSRHIPILLSNGNGNYSNSDSSKLIDDYVWYIGMQTVEKKYINENINTKKEVFYLPGEYILSLSHKRKYSIYKGASYSTAIATSLIGDKMLSLQRKLLKEEINSLLNQFDLEEIMNE